MQTLLVCKAKDSIHSVLIGAFLGCSWEVYGIMSDAVRRGRQRHMWGVQWDPPEINRHSGPRREHHTLDQETFATALR
ncbi:hypothetical protein EYF80_012814 [Liparis tanakae]|uniref:Uncharacterized protein n=1 Tax=Liparis tanakae TaxID=230148 RepID=A0A4Z2IGD5_9TELE|nr:hypothetical protein EYF80_012814 [Liparis tanakae]